MGETNRGNNRNRGNEADPLEHTLQDYLTSMVGITTSIMLPNLGDLNFELRHRLINMIERMQFHGLPSKDLVLHLKKFLRIIGTMKSPTTTPDYIKLDAFMFLLGVKAEDQLYDLPNQSIITWDYYSTKFVQKFFPMAKSEQLIREIGNFAQYEQESLSKAREQYKGLQRSCPHHGYLSQRLVHIFYGGLSQHNMSYLDSAAGGTSCIR